MDFLRIIRSLEELLYEAMTSLVCLLLLEALLR